MGVLWQAALSTLLRLICSFTSWVPGRQVLIDDGWFDCGEPHGLWRPYLPALHQMAAQMGSPECERPHSSPAWERLGGCLYGTNRLQGMGADFAWVVELLRAEYPGPRKALVTAALAAAERMRHHIS